jgi:hypothetical protein
MIEHLFSTQLFKTAIYAARKPVTFDVQTASYHLPYPKSTLWFLRFSTVFFFVIGLGMPFLDNSNWLGQTMLIFFASCFVVFSLMVFGESFGGIIFYDDFQLTSSNSILGITNKIQWKEIISIEYSTLFYWFILKSTTGKKIRVSRFRTGFNDFIQNAYRNLTPQTANEFSAIVAVYHDKGTADP